jgi:hypothetical protein
MLLLYARQIWIAKNGAPVFSSWDTFCHVIHYTMMMVDPVLEIILQVESLEKLAFP